MPNSSPQSLIEAKLLVQHMLWKTGDFASVEPRKEEPMRTWLKKNGQWLLLPAALLLLLGYIALAHWIGNHFPIQFPFPLGE
jgi:hypothetical protein